MGAIHRFFQERVWSALPPEVRPRDRRLAGWAWPCVLLLLAGVMAWKNHRHDAPMGLRALALVIVAFSLGLALLSGPAIGDLVYRAVMRVFMTVGFVVSHAALILFFYLVVSPLGIAMRMAGKDFLGTRPGVRPAWTPRRAGTPERRRYYRLF
jgi:hypothetical protein